jgi:hypothetical protein
LPCAILTSGIILAESLAKGWSPQKMNFQFSEQTCLARTLESFPHRIPKRTLSVLLCLGSRPRGIALPDLTDLLHGEIKHSNHTEWLRAARRETTKKQLHRARHFLNKNMSNISIAYCRQQRLWKLIPSL